PDAFDGTPLVQVLLDDLGRVRLEIGSERLLRVVRGRAAAIGAAPAPSADGRGPLDVQANLADRPALDGLVAADQNFIAHCERSSHRLPKASNPSRRPHLTLETMAPAGRDGSAPGS